MPEVRLTINDAEVVAEQGASLLHTCLDNGVPVPYFCDHRKLDPIGACRMCVVQIEKQPKLATACTVTVAEGMVVHTESQEVIQARQGVLEFLLINHPLDCPVCDKGGECDLQDFAFYHGTGESRFIEEKLKYPKPVPLSDRILLDMERCVLCERCVRYFDEVTEESQLVLLNRGVHAMIGTFNGEALDSAFQGNIMELCPVGALTSADWRFSARPWDMRSTPSICTGCSMGCNDQVQTRDERIVRLLTRDNPAVDDGWLCDRGRYGFHYVHANDRIIEARLAGPAGHGTPAEYSEAVAFIAARLGRVTTEHGAGAVGFISSPQATNEESFLFQRWAREVVGSPHLDHRILLDSRTPSTDDFALAIEDLGSCDAVYVIGDQATVDLAPVLELSLKKARRRRQTRLVLARGRSSSELASEARDGEDKLVGVVVPEHLQTDAMVLSTLLQARGIEVRRLLVLPDSNSRGAVDMGCVPELGPGYRPPGGRPGMGTWEMLEAAAAGRMKALVVMGPTALSAQADNPLLRKALAAVDLLVAMDIRETVITQAAHAVLPLHSFAEKDGTITNLEGRVQRLRPAIPPVAKTPPDWRVLQDLANESGAGWSYRQASEVMRDVVVAVPEYGVHRAGERALWWPASVEGVVG
ncbi:MAG: NADH-quinone oxidoreductase subunit G [Candidatus Dormibacteria bacterium]